MLILSILVVLLSGLNLVAGENDEPPNLDIWDIDKSCESHRSTLQKAYNDVGRMAIKALKDVRFVQQPRPSHLQDRIEWDRIVRAFENMFGFKPEEKGTGPGDEYFQKVLGVYERMNEALYGKVNYPLCGFSGLYNKPLWMCGDTLWEWHTKEMNDPSITPTKPLYLSRPNIFTKATGAWIYGERFITNGDSGSVGICRPSVWAVTRVREDFITFCDSYFSAKVSRTESPVDGRNSVVAGKKLDDFGVLAASRIMFHELVHWHQQLISYVNEVKDEQAVLKEGELIWSFKNAAEEIELTTTKKGPDEAYTALSTYGYTRCSRLARSHPGSKFAENSGPSKATKTAETYAYFAMMAYLDNYDWSGDGKAKKIDWQT
ncbi:hypothetical protein MKX08_006143 [Trichoderma sp. CBMAI-0020]|nr:hypothetical protein MKX08_006143 [Trichoderma sp. CBMAI-0020]